MKRVGVAMIKISSLSLIMIVLFTQAPVFSDEDSLEPEYQVLVKSLVAAFSTDNREAISKLVRYPLAREYPLPSIDNEKALLLNFDQIFDKNLTTKIVNSSISNDWSAVGWRGIMLGQGLLWMDYDGTIIGVNYQSEAETRLRNDLIDKEKNSLYSSLRVFEEPVLVGVTDKFIVRIDDLGNLGYRYAVWPKDSQQSSKPDLILKNGEIVFDGSGGNHYFNFKNGNYVYKVSVIVMGSDEDPPGLLEIYKSDELILTQKITEFLTPS